MKNLNKRLALIATLVPKGARVCDIGTDHGYLSIELIRKKIATHVIASDINEKPLQTAKKNIKNSGVEAIELRLCDGLCGIQAQEVDTVIISGLGGEVIAGIIDRGSDITENSCITLILQPTTSPEFLRRFLYNKGYEIAKELPVHENGKLYSVMVCNYIGQVKDCLEYFYYIGKVTPCSEEGRLYIEKQYNRCLKCVEALSNIGQKKKEFEYYRAVCEDLNNILKKG